MPVRTEKARLWPKAVDLCECGAVVGRAAVFRDNEREVVAISCPQCPTRRPRAVPSHGAGLEKSIKFHEERLAALRTELANLGLK